MKHEPIDYQDCINLGFKHIHLGDELFIKQYGYDWFTVDKRVMKQLYFTWNCESRLVFLVRGGKKNVKAKMPVYNFEHLNQLINFFDKSN